MNSKCDNGSVGGMNTVRFGRFQIALLDPDVDVCWKDGKRYHPLGRHSDLKATFEAAKKSGHDLVQRVDLDCFEAFAAERNFDIKLMDPEDFDTFRDRWARRDRPSHTHKVRNRSTKKRSGRADHS